MAAAMYRGIQPAVIKHLAAERYSSITAHRRGETRIPSTHEATSTASQKLKFLQSLAACFLQGFSSRESNVNTPGSAFQMWAVNLRKPTCFGIHPVHRPPLLQLSWASALTEQHFKGRRVFGQPENFTRIFHEKTDLFVD